MTTLRVVLSTLFLAGLAGFCMADADTDLAKENAELKRRVTRLEQDLAELKRIVLSQTRAPDRTDASKAAAPAAVVERDQTKAPLAATLSEDELEQIAAMIDKKNRGDKGPLSDIEIKPYGYIKWDASYDTSRIEPGNFAKWVESEAANRDDNQFNITGNQTRLGIRISGKEKGPIQSSGLVEVDFFGNGSAENTAAFMMRHAYLKLDWPDERFNIIAGQTWDVFSPLNPYTLNYSVQWWTGNPDHFDSWSLNVDLTQPVNNWLTVQAELFTGENLSAYLGGIGQGINTTSNREIGSRGGWIAARINPWDKWDFNIGASIDDVDDSDLVGMTGDRREYNRAIFGNVIYSINKSTQVGFELSQWHTEYQDQRDADSIRAQTSLIYKF